MKVGAMIGIIMIYNGKHMEEHEKMDKMRSNV